MSETLSSKAKASLQSNSETSEQNQISRRTHWGAEADRAFIMPDTDKLCRTIKRICKNHINAAYVLFRHIGKMSIVASGVEVGRKVPMVKLLESRWDSNETICNALDISETRLKEALKYLVDNDILLSDGIQGNRKKRHLALSRQFAEDLTGETLRKPISNSRKNRKLISEAAKAKKEKALVKKAERESPAAGLSESPAAGLLESPAAGLVVSSSGVSTKGVSTEEETSPTKRCCSDSLQYNMNLRDVAKNDDDNLNGVSNPSLEKVIPIDKAAKDAAKKFSELISIRSRVISCFRVESKEWRAIESAIAKDLPNPKDRLKFVEDLEELTLRNYGLNKISDKCDIINIRRFIWEWKRG